MHVPPEHTKAAGRHQQRAERNCVNIGFSLRFIMKRRMALQTMAWDVSLVTAASCEPTES
jgi:hypothetical protein